MERFDAIVVGSGFGGSVMACRLAEAGLHVCVLEKGQAYPPHSFPRSPYEMSRNVWDPSEGHYGLYNVWAFKGIWVVCVSGLGGGSLAYANVLLRKPRSWFVEDRLPGAPRWPVCYEELDWHYGAVERDLGADPYPFDQHPYDATPKTREFRAAALQMEGAYQLPRLAISFRARPDGEARIGAPLDPHQCNLHCKPNKAVHAYRWTCRLCGECVFGCNFGSKNTLDYTLLTRAQRGGAEIRTLSEVQTIEPVRRGDGSIEAYEVGYQQLDPRAPRHEQPPKTHRKALGDRVIIAAGALNTTHLLLRMKRHGYLPQLSDALGTRVSGNGDALAVAARCELRENGGARPRLLDPGHGPAITSALQLPDRLDGGGETEPGLFLEEGAYPGCLSWIVEMAAVAGLVRRSAAVLASRLWYPIRRGRDANVSGEIAAILGPATASSRSLPLHIMGRDVPDGRVRLAPKNDRLRLDWTMAGSRAYFDRAEKTAGEMIRRLGGHQRNPLEYLRKTVTVHQLGGCPMGHTSGDGVVNARGEVFGYPRLYVADGSVLPGPVGPNPSLTIAAVSSLFAQHIIDGG